MLSGYNSRTVAGLASGLRAGGGGGMARGSGACSSSPIHGPEFYYGCSGHLRHVSQLLLKSNAKRAFLVDTLALVSGCCDGTAVLVASVGCSFLD